MSLAHRSNEPEEMDAPSTDAQTYAICLRDLSAVNRVTLTHWPILRWLQRAIATLPPGRVISVLDVACGHGDLLRAISRWATRRGIEMRLEGIDLNARGAEVAAHATPASMAITYTTADVFAFTPQPDVDFIISSQFAHHLTDDDVVRLLAWMNRYARHGWFIADLQRHRIAYHGFPVLATVAGWHRIVRKDGRISIARSFRRAEWLSLLARAGVVATVTWQFPFRFCVGAIR